MTCTSNSSRAARGARAAVAVAGLTAGLLLAGAGPAAAEVVDPPGACVGTGSWQDGGFAADSATTGPTDVIDIPRADTVAWTGTVNGPTPGQPRPIAGSIALKLPPPLGYVTVRDWQGTGINVATAGSEGYDLPAQVPAGVVFQLRGQHQEDGAVHCTGTASLRIVGGPFDTAWIWVALAGTAGLLFLLFLLGRAATGGFHTGRAVTGGLLGLLSGIFLALTVLLFGLVPLASVVLTIVALLGLLLGAAWGGWAPLGRATVAPVAAGSDAPGPDAPGSDGDTAQEVATR
jgi:hypothetical protein